MKILINYLNQFDRVGLALIIISSALLGIWATVHTIAFRNILLVLGTILATSYWIKWLKTYKEESKDSLRLEILSLSPLILIGLMFTWVVIHYFFLAQFPEKQWDQLTSTWLRALLAAIIGSATGLALQQKKLDWLLWFGLFISFLVLLYQYIPKALENQSLFAPDFFGNYIYWAKFNGVLVGGILIAGLIGLFIDKVRDLFTSASSFQVSQDVNIGSKRYKNVFFIYVILGILVPIYSFVFIFDSKNGVFIGGSLLIFWTLIGLAYLAYKFFKRDKELHFFVFWAKFFFGYLVIVTIIISLSIQQIKKNPGWEFIISDVIISADVEKRQNWINPGNLGYPKRDNGQPVAHNTYERVAWAIVGLRLIHHNQIGSGLFRDLPEQLKILNVDFVSAQYTHSAWIDIGLAFGIPGLLLIPLSLIMILVQAATNRDLYYRASLVSISICMLVLYLIGEQGFQHGIEILFYMTSLLSTLFWVKTKNSVKKQSP